MPSDETEEGFIAEVRDMITMMLETHVESDHYPITHDEITQLIREGKEHQTVVKRVVELLEGKPIRGPSGHIIAREDGLMKTAQQSNALLVEIDRRTNGGVTVTQKMLPQPWSPKQKVAAWTAFGAFMVQFVATMSLFIGG